MQAKIVDRKIILQRDFIFQGDNNAVKVEFICKKQYGEHDLSRFNAFVKLTLTDGATVKILLTQRQADDQNVIFEWLIDGGITAAVGTLRYQIVFEAIDSQTVINTEIAEVEVRESLSSHEENVESYEPSLIITMQQLISQNSLNISEQKNRIDNLDSAADTLQTGLSQAQSGVAANSDDISSLQTDLNRLESNIDEALDDLSGSRLFLEGEAQDGYRIFIRDTEQGRLDSVKIFGESQATGTFDNPSSIKNVPSQINFLTHGKNFIQNANYTTNHGQMYDITVYQGLCKAPSCFSYSIKVNSQNPEFADSSLFRVTFSDGTTSNIKGLIESGSAYLNFTKDITLVKLLAWQKINSQISEVMLVSEKQTAMPSFIPYISSQFSFNVKDTAGQLHTLSSVVSGSGVRTSDEIAKIDDKYKIIKKIHRKNLRGIQWILSPAGTYFYAYVTPLFKGDGINSSHFKQFSITDDEPGIVGAELVQNNILKVRPPNNLFPTIAGWQSFSNNNDIFVEYELKEPLTYTLDQNEAQKLENIAVFDFFTAIITAVSSGTNPLLDITEIRSKDFMHYVILTDKGGNKKAPLTVAEQVLFKNADGTRQNLQTAIEGLISRISVLESN